MFTWRIKHESLAFRTNLARRGVPVDDVSCYFCGRADEDGAHLFIKCKVVKEVWRELALEKERMELEKILSVHDMLDFLWGLTKNKRLHILTFWWLWWSNRNKLREGELPVATEEIARRARCCVLEYQQIFGLPLAMKNTGKWCPPRYNDMIKINMDGSFLPGETHAGWGVVARTAKGDIICAQAGQQENVQDAFAAEEHAMAHVVSLAADMVMIRVVFETDSQLLSEALDLGRVERVLGYVLVP